MMNIEFLQAMAASAFAAGGAYWAVKTEMRWMRADIEEVKHRVTETEKRLNALEKA